jgi:hypothetical protein
MAPDRAEGRQRISSPFPPGNHDVKYRTQFIIAGSPRAQVYQLDLEAPSAGDAARDAESHWKGRLIPSEGAIHVYEIDPGTGDASGVCALIRILGRTQFHPETLPQKGAAPEVKKKRTKLSKKRIQRSHR